MAFQQGDRRKPWYGGDLTARGEAPCYIDTDLTKGPSRRWPNDDDGRTGVVSSRGSVADQDRKVMQGDGRPIEAVEDLQPPPGLIGVEPVGPDGLNGLSQFSTLTASLSYSELGEKTRLDQIKESHALLRQFTPRELKILTALKRNTSTKAWSLREDLVVLTLPMSNRELAHLLHDRNKEAVKKRLQLLRSKGLSKR